MTPVERDPTTLIGRDRELADLAAFLDAAAVRPMVMVLLGPPGIGKTALLGAAAVLGRERGFQVRSDLLGTPADRPRTLTALVPALERASADAPVLFLLDEADRADREPLELLVEALRHCTDERVALLLAARAGESLPWIGPPAIRYRVRPLADDAAARLLDTRTDGHGDRIRRHFLYRQAGNPLALLRHGNPHTALPDEFRRLFDDLPAETRRLLLHAALADEAEPAGTVTRAGGGSPDLAGWAPAERAGLVTVTDGRIYFSHPLTGACRAALAGPAELRQTYANLAAHSDDPSCRARYQAAAIGRPDETVAQALEDAADLAEGRADYLAAARGLQEAARHSPAATDAARRYARAVFAAYRTGEPAWALTLYRGMPAQVYDPDVLGVAAAGAGLALVQLARPVEAFELSEAAARRWPRDGQITLTVVAVAATAALMSGRADHRARLPELLDLTRADSPGGLGSGLVPRSVAPHARASVLAVAEPAAPVADAGEPGPAMTGLAEVARMLFTGTTAWLQDDSARTTAELAAVWQAQRHSGAPGSLVARLPLLILAMLDSGRWTEAARLIDEAEHLAAVGGIPLLRIVLPALRATLHAWTSEDPAGPALPDAPEGNTFAAGLRHRALGLSRLAAGDHDTAYAHFRALFDEAGEPVHFFLGPRSLPQLALTATLSGRTAEAREIVAGCRRADRAPTARMVVLLNHAAALLEDTDDAETHFERATADPDRAQQWPLEFAEARFSYALWLRRQHRLRESRPHLQAALETYLRLGARAHADYARRFLPGSTDSTDRRAAAAAFAGLTAQKRQIVRLAAAGLTNREIGRRLNLSPRTVGSHLYHVFPVLGVQNRHRLRELLADLAEPAGTGD
ncbi:helix-turn-helix transcriptional regulator [Paractinoplanes maris]|uniref:helix-turn-helix transcriptional regulator n=1 Tax=Paractinoplanes maris TaxID=1734446 RepID=UPI002021759A|nr:LuxR C-terminal-related transcriptional regulator [Actinoplanes maris]